MNDVEEVEKFKGYLRDVDAVKNGTMTKEELYRKHQEYLELSNEEIERMFPSIY